MFVDTHCHIHEADYPLDTDTTILKAHEANVDEFICVGTSIQSSRDAVLFAANHDEAYASIGVHPHETKDGYKEIESLIGSKKLIAVGEVGLDYYYNHSPRETQIEALKWHIELALQHHLPLIFHVREAFDDFWPIIDHYSDIRGVLHSFTDSKANLDEALRRGFMIGVNGISTFTKDEVQRAMFSSIPLSSLLLETDAPFLTPAPFRGKVNEPAFIRNIAEFHADLRGVSLEEIMTATTANARALFAL